MYYVASNREFIEQVANAVEEVHQAAQAILRQNELVLSDRQLRLQQQEDLWLSVSTLKEVARIRKSVVASPVACALSACNSFAAASCSMKLSN